MTKTKSKILWTVFSVLLVVYVLFQLTGPKSGAGRRIIDVDPIGSLDGLSEDLKRAFDPAGHFQPVPKPGRGDWLAQHDEPGQSYHRYVNHHCVVNGANNLRESDAQPLHLCPVCLRKLHFAVALTWHIDMLSWVSFIRDQD